MTPSRAQYFFARPWLSNAWLIAVPLVCIVIAVRASGTSSETISEWPSLLLLIGVVTLAALLGYVLALLLGWLVFGPLYYARGLKNGAPFHEGDLVRILFGTNRDRVVRVYEVWESRDQVRVVLGEQERKDVTDVFSPYQICRERDA
jgi:hypothetical protein